MKKHLFKKSAAIMMATLVATTGLSLPTLTTVFADEDIAAEYTVNEVESVAAESAKTENAAAEQQAEQVKIEESAQQAVEVKEALPEQAAITESAPLEEKAKEEAASTEEKVIVQQTANEAKNTQAVEEEAPVVQKDLTVHIINILNNSKSSVNGKAVPYEYTMNMVKGQGKLTTGLYSFVGGKNYSGSTAAGSVKFLNAFVLTNAGGDIVSTSGTSADGFQTVKKVQYKDYGEVILTYADGSTQTMSGVYDIYVAPVYQMILNSNLNYYYIDNISTGSGSWSSQSGFSSYKHTFSDPSVKTPVSHYKFLYWENTDKNTIINAGQADSYSKADVPQGTTKDVYTYANWQPSVTVRYYDYDGSLLFSGEIERYEDIDIYDSYDAPEMEGADFLGWYEGTGAEAEQIEETATATLPGITVDPVERKIVEAYAHYNTSYTVKHLQQNINDDGYTEVTEDQEVIKDVLAGTSTEALAKDYEGFTAQEVSQATIARDGSTVIEIKYDRNVYSVTYAYDESAPENAPELPEDASYRFGADVTIADEPTLDGYKFSGWSLAEDFEMPAEDIVITGSFTEIPKVVPAAVVTNPTAPTATPTNTPDGQINVPTTTTNTQAIADNQTPQVKPAAQTIAEVEETAVPLAATSQWALMNLILSIASAVMALIMVLSFVIGKRQEEDEYAQTDDRKDRSRNGLKFLGLIPAIGSFILFLLTENMSNPMVLTDRWTLLTAIITVVTMALMILVKNRKDKEDREIRGERAFDSI